MFRSRVFVLIALFLFGSLARAYLPPTGMNPCHGAEVAGTVEADRPTDDEYGPLKPFKSKRRSPAPPMPLVQLVERIGAVAGYVLAPPAEPEREPSSRRARPELRPPISPA